MAKHDDGKIIELEDTKKPCYFCNLDPEEKRYATKMEIRNPHDPRQKPLITAYKCKEGKNDCPMLAIYDALFGKGAVSPELSDTDIGTIIGGY